MAKKKKPKDLLRSNLSTHVAKICAYRAVGNETEAKRWAALLVLALNQAGLVRTGL